MIVQHQAVLASLKLSHPDNLGLIRAYNNSQILNQKFEEKTFMNTLQNMDRNEKITMSAIRQETEYQNRNGTDADNQTEIQEQTRQNGQEQKHDITVSPQQTQKLTVPHGGQEEKDTNMGNQQGNDNGKGRNT